MGSSNTYFKSASLSDKLPDGTYEFVASDETPDRYGDIVMADGWDLKNYRKNPIVLFGHQHNNPVGISTRVWIEGTTLKAKIKLADEGTSPFIDSLRKLVEQKIVRAVSVGFRVTEPPEYIRDPKTDSIVGMRFVGQELLENSLVTVPANPSALATAKMMGIPETHIQRMFMKEHEGASAQMLLQKAVLDMARLGASSR